eukprot:scaffold7966_cov51-Phaeocystis_antarctica.AAC.7
MAILAKVMRALGEPSAVMRPVLEEALRFDGPARWDLPAVLTTYLPTHLPTHYDSLRYTHRPGGTCSCTRISAGYWRQTTHPRRWRSTARTPSARRAVRATPSERTGCGWRRPSS